MACLDNCDSSVVPVGQQRLGVGAVMTSSSAEAHSVYSGSKCWEHRFTGSALCVEHLALWQAVLSTVSLKSTLWEDETWGYIQIQSNMGTVGLIADLPALRKLPVRVQGGLRIQWDCTLLCSELSDALGAVHVQGWLADLRWSPSATLHSFPLLPLRGSDHRICTVSYKSLSIASDLECWTLKWATLHSPYLTVANMIATSWEPDFEAGNTSKWHLMLNAKGVCLDFFLIKDYTRH